MRQIARMRTVGIAGCIAVTAAASGCGNVTSRNVPAGCNEGPSTVLRALRTAPERVTLDGTPISSCFQRNARGDSVQIVGTSLVTAAQQLGDRASGDAAAALQLGYLVGASQRGLKQSGTGAELVRRMQAETSAASAQQKAAYARGLRAGLAGG